LDCQWGRSYASREIPLIHRDAGMDARKLDLLVRGRTANFGLVDTLVIQVPFETDGITHKAVP